MAVTSVTAARFHTALREYRRLANALANAPTGSPSVTLLTQEYLEARADLQAARNAADYENGTRERRYEPNALSGDST
jgi:hypothetical protein